MRRNKETLLACFLSLFERGGVFLVGAGMSRDLMPF